MPTGQNANRTKCQPNIMPTQGWHFVRTFFCGWHFVRPKFLVGILSGPSQHVLAFCHSTQDYHSIKFRLLRVTFGCGGSLTAFRLLCCVVMCLLRLALFANVFPYSLQSNVVSVSNSSAAAHFHRRSFALTPESPLIC